MGKKASKDNKSMYLMSREAVNLTREEASEIMLTSASRLEKMENGKTSITPTDVIAMAKCYKDPSLCNYYCTHDCELGKEFVPELKIKSLSQTTLELVVTLNHLIKEKDRLLEITVDGDISADEYTDFERIQNSLNEMSMAIDTLQLWVDQKIGDGTFNGTLTDK